MYSRSDHETKLLSVQTCLGSTVISALGFHACVVGSTSSSGIIVCYRCGPGVDVSDNFPGMISEGKAARMRI